MANLSGRPVEQLYYGGGLSGWGEDLLRGVEMAPSSVRAMVLPGLPGATLRAVWTDGRAIELRGLDPCRNKRIVLADNSIRAD